jgi:RNA polymerase sigma factor (sigma-70 family)
MLSARSLDRWLRKALETLDARETCVLSARFGLDADEEQTLSAVSHQLGVSSERVRQIERAALERLRGSLHAAVLREFLSGRLQD